MMIRYLKLILPVSLLLFACKNVEKSAEVYFIPTLHGLHKTNVSYSYDSLRTIITKLNPDIIAVEIRPEDIDQDSIYLANCYPYEMRMMKNWFPDTEITGFDWLGSDIEGRLIPDGYWENMELKLLERQMFQDSVFRKKMEPCREFMNERMVILRNSTLEQILKSKDVELVVRYYDCFENVVSDSPYSSLYEFYAERDEKILSNLNKLISENKNKRIVILAGGDHYAMLKDKLPHNSLY